MTPTAIDVFSGCGGLTGGLKNAGFSVLAGIETDTAAATAYRMNYPDVLLFGDIRNVAAEQLMKAVGLGEGDIDLLAGCSPCQGFSRMRTRNRRQAAEDDRNDLILDFIRLAEGLRPKVIMFENVPGLLYDGRFAEMKQRLENTKSGGFTMEFDIVDLYQYGIPQHRRRLIVIASRLGAISLPLAEGLKHDVEWAIRHLPCPQDSDDPLHRAVSQHSESVMDRIRKTPKDGGSRRDLGEEAQLPCHRGAFGGYRDVYGRMAWRKPSPTITRFSNNPSKGRYLHPEQDRAITLREAALLQTFPSDYQFPLAEFGRLAIASMIGDALPPEFARQLGEHIKRHIEEHS